MGAYVTKVDVYHRLQMVDCYWGSDSSVKEIDSISAVLHGRGRDLDFLLL